MILNPKLPPKNGYIEVEIDGVRQYQEVITEKDLESQDQDSFLVDLEYRMTLLESGVK